MAGNECPDCHSPVENPGARFCPECGYEFGVARRKPGETASETPSPDVGPTQEISDETQVWVNDVFAPQTAQAEPASPPNQPLADMPEEPTLRRHGLSGKWIVVIAVVAVLVIAGGIVIGLLVTRDRDVADTTTPTVTQTTVVVSSTSLASTTSSIVTTSATELTTTTTEATTTTTTPEQGVAETLNRYFNAINSGEPQTAWGQLSAALQGRQSSYDDFASGISTSSISDVRIREVTVIDPTTVLAYVTFVSSQDPSLGPRPGESQTQWTLDYTFKLVDGVWLMDRVSGHDGTTSFPL